MFTRFALIAAAAALLAACTPPAQNAANPNANPNVGNNGAPNQATMQTRLNSEQREQLETLIKSYLDASAANNAQGFGPSGINDEIADLQPGADHRWRINLRRGVSYRILGVCDNECSDVDIEVLDSSGAVVGSDVLADDIPIVNVQPGSDTSYNVRIMLKNCTVAPCYVGARVLQQGA
ncbi:MAG: hypothetical protein WDM79_18755 [Terricaulis sp.]